jgi:probable DNA repair protein
MEAVLARGGRIVAANPRAARALRVAFAENARLRGLSSWAAPPISDWAEWTARLYDMLLIESEDALPQPLTPLQEELLWRRVQREEAVRVVSPGRLAKLASDAYALLSSYNAHDSRKAPWAADASEDAERFLDWASSFEGECTRLHVASRGKLDAIVTAHLTTLVESSSLEAELLLVGFDRLTPAQTKLLDAIAEAGCGWNHAELAPPAAESRTIAAQDERTEIDACAQWIRTQLLHSPTPRIGVLTPQLAGMRAAIERGFRRVLLPPGVSLPEPYEFSLGSPLAEIPSIAAALDLLEWLVQPIPAAAVSSLLISGFLAATPAEAAALAEADVTLRRHGLLRTELALSTLLRDADRLPTLLPASVHERLRNAQSRMVREESARRTYAEWSELVPLLLQTLGWPGVTDRGSIPFQAQKRWVNLVDEMAQLGFAGDRVRIGAYLSELRGAAVATLFSPESTGAPVQIIGIAEASGRTFDAVWVLGMTEQSWPQRGRPHPLLAPWLQRDHGMPYTLPQLDLAFAQEQLQRVLASAPRVVWSYARQSGATEQRPSPMLCMVTTNSAAAEAPALASPSPPVTECIADPLQGDPWPSERRAGGSEIIKRQSSCGFQSFAHRLGAAPLDDEAWGLEASERAVLLHRALEHLWSSEPVPASSLRIHTLDDLLRLIEDDRTVTAVREAVTVALHSLRHRFADDTWTLRYLDLEADRLCKRLLYWLDQDSKRAPFRVVGLEQTLEDARIGELRLRLRLDRADVVANNRLLLIDYKTADRVSTKQWEGERPDEPQLPIYALYGNAAESVDPPCDGIAGIAFAQIRAGEGKSKLHALAEDPAAQLGPHFATAEGKAPRHVLSNEMREGWNSAIRSLAVAFLQGAAPVNPKHGATTCRYCGMEAICRVRSQGNRATLLADAIEEGDGSDG